MDKITPDFLKKVDLPFPNLLKRYICLLLDDSGDILDIEPKEVGNLTWMVKRLKKLGNIRPAFLMDPRAGLSSLIKKQSVFQGDNRQFKIEEDVERFYIAFPFFRIRISPITPDRLGGLITVGDIIPSFFERPQSIIVYLDRHENLVGFNQGLPAVFGEHSANPDAMLNRPFSSFFTPAPSRLQKEALKRIKIPGADEFQEIYSRDFVSGTDEIAEDASNSGDFHIDKRGLFWACREDEGSFLFLPAEVDFEEHNVAVRFRARSEQKTFPFVMFGDKDQEGGFGDTHGYLIGIDPDNNRALLKKQGFILFARPLEWPGGGELDFEVMMVDNALVLKVNGRSVLRYFDHDFIRRGKTHVTLYLRNNFQCLVKSASVHIQKSKKTLLPRQIIVRAKDRGRTPFLLTRFDNYYITSHQGNLYGYKLQNFRDFQNRLTDLEKRYQKEVEHGHKLHALLDRYLNQESGFVGSNEQVVRIKEKATRVANSSASILIQGQTGTGKEVLAKYIHHNSPFNSGPFIKVDCSVIPATLIESELFGHEKGAFTGAHQQKAGLFEQAHTGTLFLDEIGNLTREIQMKLLQFLNDFTIMRVGGTKPIKLQVRLISASNRDLREMVERNLFRDDLYYRIAIVSLELPALRDRRDDLPELCNHFLDLYNKTNHKNIKGISPAAYRKIFDYDWPGNIRQLKNAVEQAVVFCDGHTIEPENLHIPEKGPLAPAENAPPKRALRFPKKLIHFSREDFVQVIRKYNGIVTKTAEALNVNPRALYYHLKKLNLDPNDFRKYPRKAKG